MENKYPFKLPPLPYAYDALEPFIDTETMKLHHDKHLGKYVDTLNTLLSTLPQCQSWTLEQLILDNEILPLKLRIPIKNNAGGVYNHTLFFSLLTPDKQELVGSLKTAIINCFDSLNDFATQFVEEAVSVFGSGYAWLVVDREKKLKIIKSSNQDVPMNVLPVLLLDVWEHAYYLKYQNRRQEYCQQFFNIIDWEQCEKRYLYAMKYLSSN